MVAKIESIKNIHIMDAPAGSGKTYHINKQLSEFLINNPHSKALAITYTNRAADQIKKNVNDERVFVSTIHSYINTLIEPFFCEPQIVELYLDKYKGKIESQLKENNDRGVERNRRYEQHYANKDSKETIFWAMIKKNLKGISYGESKFSAYYYGILGHDDLLDFANVLVKKFPKLYMKINRQFQLIIIDEYQDTQEEVLNLFIDAASNHQTELFLYGDVMQQIYQSYSEKMQSTLSAIGIVHEKIYNYRSNSMIVNLLNSIDGNKDRIQSIPENSDIEDSDYPPQVFIVQKDEVDKYVDVISKKEKNILILFIFNKERFGKIGSLNLFNAYSKIYNFSNKISPRDVLLEFDPKDNPDDLMHLLLILKSGTDFWKKRQYGELINLIIRNNRLFCENIKLKKNEDKNRVNSAWKATLSLLYDDEITIEKLLIEIMSKKIFHQSIIDGILQSEEYEEVLGVKIKEFINLIKNSSKFSTQHGVKGESHDSIIFVAEDSTRTPRVKMYDFLRVWSQSDMSVEGFEDFAIKYIRMAKQFEIDFKSRVSMELLKAQAEKIVIEFANDRYFQILLKNSYTLFIKEPLVKNGKLIMRGDQVWSILTAYKLFYVGCSRSRRNLTVILDKDSISEFESKLTEKLTRIGFCFPNDKVI